MGPYNVMTNLEVSENGRYLYSTKDKLIYYNRLTFNKEVLIFNKGVLCGKVIYKYYPSIFFPNANALRYAQAIEFMVNMINFAITHPVDAVVALSATPVIGSRTDTLYRVLCIYETAGIRVMPHKYLNIHNIRCGISAYLVNAAYEACQVTHRYGINFLDAMSGIEVEVDDEGSIPELSHWTQPTDIVFDSIPALTKNSRDVNKRPLTKEEYVHDSHPRVFGYGKTAYAMFIDESVDLIMKNKRGKLYDRDKCFK